MALSDFFKRLKGRKITEQEVKITFSEVRNYIEKSESENRIKEKQVFDLIEEKINYFLKVVREKVSIAEGIDIDSKKAEDQFKSLTKSGREKYMEFVEGFIHDLEALEKKDLEKFIKDIDKLFSSFNKSSRGNYERATVLIGKEMKAIREQIKNLSDNLAKIFDKNKGVADLYMNLFSISEKLNQIDENKEANEKVENEILPLDLKIKRNKKEIEKIIEEIERTKKSKDYLKIQETKEKIKSLESGLDKNILDLRQLVDFKALSSFFHIFENQMDIVKEHKDDFKTAFKKDYGESILNLLNDSKLNNESIDLKVKEIKNKREKIIDFEKDIGEDETEVLSAEIKKIKSEVDELNDEKEIRNKMRRKLKTDIENLETEIINELGKMRVVVEDRKL